MTSRSFRSTRPTTRCLPIPSKYPVDKNNVAPRLGLVWNPDQQGKSVVRAGYGMFYDRTLLGTVDNFLFDTKYSKTFTASFPQSAADPGPSNGRLPTDPLLALVTRVRPGDSGDAGVFERAPSAGDDAPKRRHGDMGRSRSQATVLPPDYCGVRA